jgi:hypothetical protein
MPTSVVRIVGERPQGVVGPIPLALGNDRYLRIAAGLANCEEGEARGKDHAQPGIPPHLFLLRQVAATVSCALSRSTGPQPSPECDRPRVACNTRGAFPPLTCLAVLARPLFTAPPLSSRRRCWPSRSADGARRYLPQLPRSDTAPKRTVRPLGWCGLRRWRRSPTSRRRRWSSVTGANLTRHRHGRPHPHFCLLASGCRDGRNAPVALADPHPRVRLPRAP